MKRLLIISLSLFILLGMLCACSSDSTSTADEAGTTEAVETDAKIYLDNAAVWEVQSTSTWFGYMFIDLDFDGTLELVQSTREANSDNTVNKFFRLDKETKTVTEISCSDTDAVSIWNFEGGDYPQLYKDNTTGQLKYMVYDNAREAATEGGSRIGELTYNETDGIKTRSMWGFQYASVDGTLEGEFTFTYLSYDENNKAQEISSDEYNKVLEDYESKNTNLGLKFKYIEQTTESYVYSDLTAEEKLNVLEEAYNAFSYTK